MKKIIVTRPLLEEDVSVVYIALRKISMSGPGYSYISYLYPINYFKRETKNIIL